MIREFYQILEVNENANSNEIKTAYRKLALQWHPDKWVGKDIKEQLRASEMMQKINQAFEILGNEEKRKRYDLGVTDFADNFNYQYDPEEEIKRQKEELTRKELNIINIELEILELEKKALERSLTINEIGAAFSFSFPRVRAEDLDSSLWQPYQNWSEKVAKMEITIPKGKDKSEELKNFKDVMVEAIKKAEVDLKIRKENKKRDDINSELNRARAVAFQTIEKYINNKGLKVENLEEYSNYQEQINSLGEAREINNFREEVIRFIIKLGKREYGQRSEDVSLRENSHNSYPMREQSNYQFSNNFNFSNDIPEFRENFGYQSQSNNLNSNFPIKSNFSNSEQNRIDDGNVRYSTQYSSDNVDNEKVKKISQLRDEIECLKKNEPSFYFSPLKWNKHQKKVEEKERELLSDLINLYDRELKSKNTNEEVNLLRNRNQQLEKEVYDLKFEIQNLKKQKNNNFEHQVYYSERR